MKVFLTDDHLGLCLEYANGGELFERVKAAGRFEENMARFFFQQLLAGTCEGPFCFDVRVLLRPVCAEWSSQQMPCGQLW